MPGGRPRIGPSKRIAFYPYQDEAIKIAMIDTGAKNEQEMIRQLIDYGLAARPRRQASPRDSYRGRCQRCQEPTFEYNGVLMSLGQRRTCLGTDLPHTIPASKR